MWPGFGENSRVLKWMCDRIDGKAGAIETPIGMMPKPSDLTLDDLEIDMAVMEELLRVDTDAYKATLDDAREYMAKFGDRLPAKMVEQMDNLEKRG